MILHSGRTLHHTKVRCASFLSILCPYSRQPLVLLRKWERFLIQVILLLVSGMSVLYANFVYYITDFGTENII